MVDRCNQLADLDREWQIERMRWLDWDREPQPVQFCSLAITSTWFITLWSLLQFVGGSAISPAVATASVLILYSPRARNFETAFLAYQRGRAAIALPVS